MHKVLVVVGAVLSGNLYAAVVGFENDFTQWSNALPGAAHTIDFEAISAPSPTVINGDEFSGHPLSPTFSIIEGNAMYVGNPGASQVLTPTSGQNTLFPECNRSCKGIIRVNFDQAVSAVGAYFIDVEADFATTGFSLNLGGGTPEVNFSASQGQNAQSFLGLISDQPFSAVDIYFATGPTIDGTILDDLMYSASPVPLPAPLFLFASSILGFFLISFRRSAARTKRGRRRQQAALPLGA